jgi:PAS domain S-box-containing protein
MATPHDPRGPERLDIAMERLLRQVRDHAMFLIGLDGRVGSWNEGVRRILGWDEDDWLGQPVAVAFTAEDAAAGVPEAELRQAATTGRADDDRWMRRRDGARFFAVGSTTAIRNDAGALVAFLKVLRDDTAGRRTTEENARLLASERAMRAEADRQAAILRATIDAIPDAVYIGTADGITSCNQRALDQLGATSIADLQARIDELGRRFRVRLERAGEPVEPDRLPFMRALRGETAVLETWATRPTGEDVLIRGAAAPIRVDGQILGAVAVNSDLTERVRMEEQRYELARMEARLREREQAFRAIVSGVRDYAIFTVDPEGCVSSWHIGAQLMKGYTHEEAIGMPFARFFTDEDRARDQPRHEMEVAARTGEYKGNGQRVRKGGETFDAEVVLTALRGPDDELLGFLKLTQDVSRRKRQEGEREETLQRTQAARVEAERASHSMSELLATISHELRTPLGAIIGWAQLLQRGLPNAEAVGQAIAAINRNARIQVQLIEDLLDVSRIESGQMRLERLPVDLASVVAGAVDAVVPGAEVKRIAIQTVLDPHAGTVLGDAARLQQIVWNLLSNAVKFTPVDGAVTLTVRRRRETVEIAVADTGQGMDEEFIRRAFDRFQQQDGSSTRRHGGLGLGLTIVRQLAQLHGGSVRAESPGPGGGSTFTVTLPAQGGRPGEPDTRAAPLDAASAPLDAGQRLKGFRLLLIDDDADGRAVAAYALRAAGAEVVEAGSAEHGLARFREHRPSAVVCDLGMPGHDGFELIGWIRDLDAIEGRRTPAAAFTAFARPDDRERVLRSGFQMHLVKPLAPVELVQAVVQLLQTSMGDTAG